MEEKISHWEAHRAAFRCGLSSALKDRGEWDGKVIRLREGPFVVTLDVHAEVAGFSSDVVTRFRAAFRNRGGFTFRIARHGILSRLVHRLSAHVLETGDPAFDAAFCLEGRPPERLLQLLASAPLRQALLDSPVDRVEVVEDEGWFGPEFPEGIDELFLEMPGRITALQQLEKMFEIFAELLSRLCQLDPGYADDPNLIL